MADEDFTPEELELLDQISADLKAINRLLSSSISAGEKNSCTELVLINPIPLQPSQSETESTMVMEHKDEQLEYLVKESPDLVHSKREVQVMEPLNNGGLVAGMGDQLLQSFVPINQQTKCTSSNFVPGIFISNRLLDLYTQCESLVDAQKVLDEMGNRDLCPHWIILMGMDSIEPILVQTNEHKLMMLTPVAPRLPPKPPDVSYCTVGFSESSHSRFKMNHSVIPIYRPFLQSLFSQSGFVSEFPTSMTILANVSEICFLKLPSSLYNYMMRGISVWQTMLSVLARGGHDGKQTRLEISLTGFMFNSYSLFLRLIVLRILFARSPIIERRICRRWIFFPQVNQALATLAFFGVGVNLVLFLTRVLGQDNAHAANNVSMWTGTVYMFSLIGAFLSDSYWGRYLTCTIFQLIFVLGLALSSLSSWRFLIKPAGCGNGSTPCTPASFGVSIFYLSIYRVAFGYGGHQPTLATIGADQYDEKIPKERSSKVAFFCYFYFALNVGSLFSTTVLVYYEDSGKRTIGFLVSLASAVIPFLSFLAGSRIRLGCLGFVSEMVQGEKIAQFSVLFLIFALDLEFSTTKLRFVRAVAILGGLLQILLIMCLCGITTSLCGGISSEGIIVGTYLSMSLTVVVLKFLRERNSINALHGQVTIGTLIVQDGAVWLLFALLAVLGQIFIFAYFKLSMVSSYTDKDLRMITAVSFIDLLVKNYMRSIKCMPFYAILCFKDVEKLQSVLIGDPRSRIQVDLLEYHMILRCSCCNKSGNSILPSKHDSKLKVNAKIPNAIAATKVISVAFKSFNGHNLEDKIIFKGDGIVTNGNTTHVMPNEITEWGDIWHYRNQSRTHGK